MTGKGKRSALVEKIRAISEIIRMDLVFGAGIFVVAGEILGLGHLPPVATALLWFLTGLFVSGSANISNDYFDRDVDRVNRPDRPLPSGRISVAELRVLFAVFAAAGLAAAALLGPAVLAMAAAVWAVALLYNIRLKEIGLVGNLAVAFCVSMTVVIGGAASGAVNGLVLTFAALAFLFDLGEEIASDAMDVEGDSLRSGRSIAARRGRLYALRLSGIAFALFVALTFLPSLAGWLGTTYLLCAAAAAVVMAYLAARLVRSATIAEGRVLVRRLYLAWGVFVIVFVVASLL
jgi:geranylgeranylglycerol-phosphate geranylgeranyltransferase